jgi:hypothetical protein
MLTTEALVTEIPEKEKPASGGGGGMGGMDTLLVRFLHLRDLGLEQFLREELHWRVPREEMVLAFREGAGGRIRRAIETADQS